MNWPFEIDDELIFLIIEAIFSSQLLNEILFFLYSTDMWLRNICLIVYLQIFLILFFFVSCSSLQHYDQQLNKIQCSSMTIISYLVGVRAYLRTRKISSLSLFLIITWEDCLSLFFSRDKVISSLSLSQYEVSNSFVWKKNSSSYRVYLLEQNWAKEKTNSFFFFPSLLFSSVHWLRLFNLLFSVRSLS
jgi:hypothetical protein